MRETNRGWRVVHREEKGGERAREIRRDKERHAERWTQRWRPGGSLPVKRVVILGETGKSVWSQKEQETQRPN